MKDLAINWAMNIAVVLLFASIPFGVGMAIYMNSSNWLWFCLPLLIFLS